MPIHPMQQQYVSAPMDSQQTHIQYMQIPVSWSNNGLYNEPIQASNGVDNAQPSNYITSTHYQQVQMKNGMDQVKFVQRPVRTKYVQRGQDPNRMNQMQMNQHISEMNQIHFCRQYPDMNQIQIVQQTLGGNRMYNSQTNHYQMVQENSETNKVQISRKSIGMNKIQIPHPSPGMNQNQMSNFPPGIDPIQFSRHSPVLNHVSSSGLTPGINQAQRTEQPPVTNRGLITQQPQIVYHVQFAQQSPTMNQTQFIQNSPKIIVISPNFLEEKMQSVQVVVPKKKMNKSQMAQNTENSPKKESQKVKPITLMSDSRVQKPKKVQLRVIKTNAPKLSTFDGPKFVTLDVSNLPTVDASKLLTFVTPKLATSDESKLSILEKVTPNRVDIKLKNNDWEAQLQSTEKVINLLDQSWNGYQKNKRVLFDNYGQFFIDRPCFEEALNRNMTDLCTVEDDDIFWAKIASAT